MKVYVILCLVDGCEAHEGPCGKNAHVQAVCTARDTAERLMELHRQADTHGGPAEMWIETTMISRGLVPTAIERGEASDDRQAPDPDGLSRGRGPHKS